MADSAIDAVAIDREVWRFKMKDLCEASGLERQAIHFYIQQELLPPGRKTGRNMAWYTQAHIDRLELIKKLQHERFLPLKAIKALLDGESEAFSPEQHRFLAGVRTHLEDDLSTSGRRSDTVALAPVIERLEGCDAVDVERAIELGLLAMTKDEHGEQTVAEADLWLLELISEWRVAGFTRELGFCVDDVAIYEEAMRKVFRAELNLLSERLSHLPPKQVAGMIERGVPLIHDFMTRYHGNRMRDLFGDMVDES